LPKEKSTTRIEDGLGELGNQQKKSTKGAQSENPIVKYTSWAKGKIN